MITRPLAEHLETYSEALKRLSENGVSAGSSRLARYEKELAKSVSNEANESNKHFGQPTFLNALLESSEIIDIASLDDVWLATPNVMEKLGFIRNGPEVVAPQGMDQGRDYAFELTTAAALQARNALGGFPLAHGDLLISPHLAKAECKRVSSMPSARNRLRDARDQLRASMSNGEGGGIIALDLTRPIRLSYGAIATENDESFVLEAEQRLQAFLSRYILNENNLHTLQEEAVLGIMVRSVSVGISGQENNVRRSVVWQALSLHEDHSELNHEFLRSAESFGQGPFRKGTAEELRASILRFPE